MISYNDFQLTSAQIEHIKRDNATRAISKYIKENGVEPSSNEKYFTATSEEMERYRRIYYSMYLAKGDEKTNADTDEGQLISVGLNVSVIDDSSSLNEASLLRLSSNEEYTYDYWDVAVYIKKIGYNGMAGYYQYKIGYFRSLNNAKITLNTLEKYAFIIHYAKSNHEINVDNKFHNFSHYLDEVQTLYEDDKEYIGFVDDFEPKIGKSVKVTVYTYNPQIIVNISGLTNGIECKISKGHVGYNLGSYITISRDSDGTITTDGDYSRLSIESESYLKYHLLRTEIPFLKLTSVINADIENKECILETSTYDISINAINKNSIKGLNDGYNTYTLLRNDTSEINIIIPPQENIDTDIDVEIIED